jgi:hypothetical protein
MMPGMERAAVEGLEVPMIARLVVPLLVLAAQLACSSPEMADADRAGDDTDTDLPSDDTDNTVDTSVVVSPEFFYWYLSGDWTVAEGAVTAALTLTWVADGDQGCALPAVPVEGSVAAATTTLLAAWDLELLPDEAVCPWFGPTTLRLGFGLPDPDLAPAADRAGLSLATSQGLYLDLGAGEVLVGLAGTDEQLAGAGAQLTEAPLPDATWRLHTLYGVPWGDAL